MWAGEADREQSLATLREFFETIRRHLGPLLAWILICLACAAIVAKTTKPIFIATTQIILEPRVIAEDGPEEVRQFHQLYLDDEQAQTQLTLIRSDRLLKSVFDELDLAGSAELGADNDSLLTRALRRWHGLWVGDPPPDERLLAFERFKSRVSARRYTLSYVIEISYRAEQGALAARVANAIAVAFVRERLATVLVTAKRRTPYLTTRLENIVSQVLVATGAVRNGLVPETDLPDASVRLLGPATPPLRKAFPQVMPLLVVAACFGLVSGVLAIGLLTQSDPRVRSRRQLSARLDVACLCAIPRRRTPPAVIARVWSRLGRRVEPDLRPSIEAARAAFAARNLIDGQSTVGFVSWGHAVRTASLAEGLSSLLAGKDGDRPRGSDPATLDETPPPAVPVVAAASLAPAYVTPADFDGLDAAILVIEAHKTTIGETRVALRMLRAADVAVAGVILDFGGRGPGASQLAA